MVLGILVLLLTGLAAVLAIYTVWLSLHLMHPPRHTTGGAIARDLPTDPVEAGAASCQTQIIAAADDVAIELWLVPGHDLPGPTIIMLHGWGDSRLGELLWLDMLLPVASRIVMFDLRGHGESDHRCCTFGAEEADDVRRIIDWAGKLEPARPIVLMGYSMGAAIAIDVASEAGAKVAGVIADSPYRKPVEAVIAVLRLNHMPTWPMAQLAIAMMALRWPALWKMDTVTAAGWMRQPLLLLHGASDQVVSSAEARAIAVAAPHGRICEVPDADHLQATNIDPEGCEHAIDDFVRRQLAEHPQG